MSSKPPPKLPTSETSPLSHNPLAKLAALRSEPPKKEPAAPPTPAPAVTVRPAAPASKPAAAKLPPGATPPLAHKALAQLQGMRHEEPSKPAAPAAPAGPVTVRPANPPPAGGPEIMRSPAWAVIRLERKGRGGKEATIVEKLGLKPVELEQWCKDLKQTLGCGGAVEGDTIVLQGDLRQRLSAVLTKRGVRKVTLG